MVARHRGVFYAFFPLLLAWAAARRRIGLTAICVIALTLVVTLALAPLLGDELGTCPLHYRCCC